MLQNLKDAFSKSDELVMITDEAVDPAEAKVLYVNDAFTSITGYRMRDMESLSTVHGKDIDPATLELYKQARKNKDSFHGFVLGEKKSGKYFWVDLTVLPFHDSVDKCWYFIHKPRIVQDYELIKDRARVMELCNVTSEMAKIGLWEWYPKTDKAFFSDTMYEIIGLNKEEIQPSFELYKDCIMDEDREKVEKKMNRIVEEGGETSQLHRIKHQDTGAIRYLKGFGRRYETQTEMIKIYGIVQDVTEYQQQIEKTHLFKQAVEASNSGIVITDYAKEDNPIIYANDTFTSLSGYDQDEIIGSNCRFLQDGDRQQKERFQLREAVNKGQSIRVKLRNYTKNGEMFWNKLSIAPIHNTAGEITNYVGVQEDITDYVLLRKDLEHQLAFKNTLVDSLPGIFTFIDEDMNYINWNANFERNLGYTPAEIEEMEPADFIAEEDRERVKQTIENIFKHGEDSVEAQLRTKQGDTIPHYLTGKRFDREEKSYFLGYGIDISDQREYREKLEDLIKQKNILINEIHHRVKNNMAIASGLLELQKNNLDAMGPEEALKKSQMRLQTMANVHEQLYKQENLTNIETDQFLRRLIDIFEEAYSNRMIEIRKHVDPFVLNVNQAIPLGLLLNELIVNACIHAFNETEEGTIEVHLEIENNQEIYAKVIDNGLGLPESFDLEHTESLGYTIIKTLAQQLDAQIDIDSDTNGTEVCITFVRKDLKGSASHILEM